MPKSSLALQPLFLPEINGVAAPLLYFRGDYTITTDASAPLLSVQTELHSDTYFNAFPLDRWCSETVLKSIRFVLSVEDGEGELIIRHRDKRSNEVLSRCDLNSSIKRVYEVVLSIEDLNSGVLFWSIFARSKLRISGAEYQAETQPIRDVRAGIVIPAFNRDVEVNDTVTRFEKSRLPGDGHLLYVVDNGGTLAGERILRNSNAVGGTGGWTRGLLELRDEPGITHAVFMDDDAPAHMGCIEKAISFLRFAKQPDIAIAGSMLFAEMPSTLYGSGLEFRVSKPLFLKSNLDLTDIENIISSEEVEHIDAGGWFFFVFPIKSVEFLPFPFFVRGDDVLFSLQNGFRILTLAGVACWQNSFETKITPSTSYLAYRARFLNGCLMSRRGSHSIFDVFNEVIESVHGFLQSYRYGNANAILDGVDDILVGPDFFKQNPSAIQRLAEIHAKYAEYYPRPFGKSELSKYTPLPRGRQLTPKLLTFLRALLQDGHRFAWLDRRPALVDGFAICPDLRLLGRREAFFWSEYDGTGVPTTRSAEQYRSVAARIVKLRERMKKSGRQCIDSYHEQLPYLQSEQFWRDALSLD